MKVKEESEKAVLKLNIQETKIMASNPISSWQIDGEIMEAVRDFIFLDFEITTDGDCSHEIKRCLLLGSKASSVQFSLVQSLGHVWLFETTWIAARQASLSFAIFWSLLKLISIESVIPSKYIVLCHPLLLLPSIFPSITVFSNQFSVHIWWPNIGTSSASVLRMNIQNWFPLGWTSLISLQSKGLLRVFSDSTVQSINSLALSFLYGPTLSSIHDYWKARALTAILGCSLV